MPCLKDYGRDLFICYYYNMKIKKQATVILIIVLIAVIAGAGMFLYFNKDKKNNTNSACIPQSPNGCPPPGMCDAPNDGYVSCDRLNSDGSLK